MFEWWNKEWVIVEIFLFIVDYGKIKVVYVFIFFKVMFDGGL